MIELDLDDGCISMREVGYIVVWGFATRMEANLGGLRSRSGEK